MPRQNPWHAAASYAEMQDLPCKDVGSAGNGRCYVEGTAKRQARGCGMRTFRTAKYKGYAMREQPVGNRTEWATDLYYCAQSERYLPVPGEDRRSLHVYNSTQAEARRYLDELIADGHALPG
jgi:hypothetical protein